jgi:hypothetical protein
MDTPREEFTPAELDSKNAEIWAVWPEARYINYREWACHPIYSHPWRVYMRWSSINGWTAEVIWDTESSPHIREVHQLASSKDSMWIHAAMRLQHGR